MAKKNINYFAIGGIIAVVLVIGMVSGFAISGAAIQKTISKSFFNQITPQQLRPNQQQQSQGLTMQEVLTNLNGAEIIEKQSGGSQHSCNDICSNGKTCIHAESQYLFDNYWIFHPIECRGYTISTLFCWCA